MAGKNKQPLRCSESLLTTGKSILCVKYEGHYPPGSEGNDVAKAMTKYAVESYGRHSPDAVMFDLTELEYIWGDAIAGIAVALIQHTHECPLLFPACVVARGRTYKALKALFEPKWAFGVAGMRLFTTIDQGMIYLHDATRTAAG